MLFPRSYEHTISYSQRIQTTLTNQQTQTPKYEYRYKTKHNNQRKQGANEKIKTNTKSTNCRQLNKLCVKFALSTNQIQVTE
jgi:hypothetical protein